MGTHRGPDGPEPDEPTAAARARDALEAVPRTGFLPVDQVDRASFDGPIHIGHGQTNSQPRTVEAMLALLDVRPGHHVLDVGSGSGWTAALLEHLVGPDGSVVAVELLPDLVVTGNANLLRFGARTRIVRARPGSLGWPESGPYDRILVSASPEHLPPELVAQLVDGGTMVIPVGTRMLRVARHGNEPLVTEHGRYRFVPLR